MNGGLSPAVVLAALAAHFALLLAIAHVTGRNAGNRAFFLSNRNAPWWLVAIGAVGATISGITFVSVPGAVGTEGMNKCFSYLQFVLGTMAGYAITGAVLLPVYYRLNLTSIYGYLERRLGVPASRTGAVCFMLARIAGSAIRLYLTVTALQIFVLGPLGVPFPITALVLPFVIWAYTFRGGTRTLIITDTIQTILFVTAVILTLHDVSSMLGASFGSLWKTVWHSPYSRVFFMGSGWDDPNNFWKQFLSGALMTTCTTGLDQDLMQKNLSCRNLRESRKNVWLTSASMLGVNTLFLVLGASLYLFAAAKRIAVPARSDEFYPMLAFHYLSPAMALVFMMGLLACTYSTTDSALTSLTTSFCVDILGFERERAPDEAELERRQKRIRLAVHLGFTFLFVGAIFAFQAIQSATVLNVLFDLHGFTYGPILGLFSFGFLTPWRVHAARVPIVCAAAVALTWIIDRNSAAWFDGLQLGFTKLALNGLFTFSGLFLVREAGIASTAAVSATALTGAVGFREKE